MALGLPRGVFAPLVTPFTDDGGLDFDAARRHAAVTAAAGVHGLTVAGSGGEFVSMTIPERRAYTEAVANAIDPETVPMLVCVAAYATHETVALAAHAEAIGAVGVLVTAPYLMRPSVAGVHRHLWALREATELPIMLYNTPRATGVDFALAEIEQLVDDGVLQGIKMSFPEEYRLRDLKETLGDRAAVFCGHDGSALESLLVGADGWISCIPVCFPRRAMALWDAVEQGAPVDVLMDYWRELLPFVRMLYEADRKVNGDPHWLEVTKLTIELLGQPVGPPRRPLARLREPYVSELRQLLIDMGELSAPTVSAVSDEHRL